MTQTPAKQFTIRIPGELYSEAKALARKRGTSINQLAASGLSELTRREREQQLSDAYALLAAHPAECDVEAYVTAQAEVLSDE